VADARQRLVSFLYACATVSLAAGFFGALNSGDVVPWRVLVTGASLVISFGLATIAWRLDQ